jgi:hypothetical protein
MRISLAVVVIAGLGGLFLWQKNDSSKEAQPTAKPAVQQSPAPAVAYGATPSREPSEHNWMKRSLDRARDVTQQSQTRTRDSQDPK